MAEAIAYTKTGTKRETATKLDKQIFGLTPNPQLIKLAYEAYLANGRSAGAKVLTRGEVRGGGKKPWRQKGTGRARAGSSRIPHWRGGGSVFGPTGEENHTITVPTKLKRQAIRHSLSVAAADKRIIVLESFNSTDGKIKPTIQLLGKLKLRGRIVLANADKNDLERRATGNLSGLEYVSAKYLNVYTIMNADHLVITEGGLKVIQEWLGEAKATNAKAEASKASDNE